MPQAINVTEGLASRFLGELGYIVVDRSSEGRIRFEHNEHHQLSFMLDFSCGSLSFQYFCFTLEHHGFDMDVVHAWFEAL